MGSTPGARQAGRARAAVAASARTPVAAARSSGSRALSADQTSPIPPSPSGAIISYVLSRMPAASCSGAENYTGDGGASSEAFPDICRLETRVGDLSWIEAKNRCNLHPEFGERGFERGGGLKWSSSHACIPRWPRNSQIVFESRLCAYTSLGHEEHAHSALHVREFSTRRQSAQPVL